MRTLMLLVVLDSALKAMERWFVNHPEMVREQATKQVQLASLSILDEVREEYDDRQEVLMALLSMVANLVQYGDTESDQQRRALYDDGLTLADLRYLAAAKVQPHPKPFSLADARQILDVAIRFWSSEVIDLARVNQVLMNLGIFLKPYNSDL